MLTIIGCGNLNRMDDGVGVAVAERLAARLRRHPVPGVQVFDCGTAGIEVMFRARGTESLIIVDACRSGGDPGQLYEVPGSELAELHEPGLSLHDFRWDHALAAGRKIFGDEFPEDVTVYLVEAEQMGLGLEMTEPVRDAAERLHHKLLHRMAEWAARRHARAEGVELELADGSIRLSREVFERFFDGREGALLMEHQGQICLMPLEQVAGGFLVKQKNLQGDRVIHAPEFLRAHGVPDAAHTVTATWQPQLGALALNRARSCPPEGEP